MLVLAVVSAGKEMGRRNSLEVPNPTATLLLCSSVMLTQKYVRQHRFACSQICSIYGTLLVGHRCSSCAESESSFTAIIGCFNVQWVERLLRSAESMSTLPPQQLPTQPTAQQELREIVFTGAPTAVGSHNTRWCHHCTRPTPVLNQRVSCK